VWAWNRGRIRDGVLARFDALASPVWKPDLYNQSGLRTIFRRPPMIERLRESKSRLRGTDYGGQVEIQRDSISLVYFPEAADVK